MNHRYLWLKTIFLVLFFFNSQAVAMPPDQGPGYDKSASAVEVRHNKTPGGPDSILHLVTPERPVSNERIPGWLWYLGLGLGLVALSLASSRTGDRLTWIAVFVSGAIMFLIDVKPMNPSNFAMFRSSGYVVIAATVLIVALVAHWVRREPSLRSRRVLIPMGIASAIILLVPGRMIMVYSGYGLVNHIFSGVIPRYGPGAVWEYGPIMWLLGGDHFWVQSQNRVIGILSLLITYILGRTLWPDRPKASVLALWTAVFLPVIWRDFSSESIVAAPTLFLLSALIVLIRQPRRPAAAAVLLVAAAFSRPEMAMIAGLVPLVAMGFSKDRITWWVYPVLLPMLVLIVGRTYFTALGLHHLDAIKWGFLNVLPSVFNAILWEGILTNPLFIPTVVILLIVFGAWSMHRPEKVWLVIGFSAIYLALTGVDLSYMSVPRLHMPVLLLLLPLVGAGWEYLFSVYRHSNTKFRTKAGLGIIVVLFFVGAGYNAFAMFRTTNESVEEGLWRQTIQALPKSPVCLVTMTDDDPPPPVKNFRQIPEYLLTTYRPEWHLYSLSSLLKGAIPCSKNIFVLLGMRCYVKLADNTSKPLRGNDPLPICSRIRKNLNLQPVFELRVPNRPYMTYRMYPPKGPLTVGLYKVRNPDSP